MLLTRKAILCLILSLCFLGALHPIFPPGHPLGISIANADDLSKPSTSRAARQAAVNSIPLNELNQEAKRKVLSVLNHTSVYRRLPVNQYMCDPDMHNFLIRYPEVVVGIWQLMGITQVDAKRASDYELRASDGMGTTSTIELLYGTKNLHVFYGHGFYEGPLFRTKLKGSCILVLRSEFGKNKNGDPVVADRLDVFLRVDNIGVKILAKTLHSLVGKTADINFTETTKFIGKVSDTAEINGPGVQRLGDRIKSLEPEVRDAFKRLAMVVNDRSTQRLQAHLEATSTRAQQGSARVQPGSARVQKASSSSRLPPIRPISGSKKE